MNSFEGFRKWLEERGVNPDFFPKEVWLSKVWDGYYGEYVEHLRNDQTHQKIIKLTSTESLKKEIDERIRIEKESQERKEKAQEAQKKN